jgi:outer membrane receptor protein involved in Fe transport
LKKIFILFLFFISSLFSQEKKNNLITLGNFQAIEQSISKESSKQLVETISRVFIAQGYSVKQLESQNLSDNLQTSRNLNSIYYIDGYFFKKDIHSNLYLYAQIYNPETGYLIDAFNLTDYLDEIKDINLDKEEMLEPDKDRLDSFSKKLVAKVQSNPAKKENKNDIDNFVIDTGFDKKYNLPLVPQVKSVEESADAVFDLLQNQVTVSATKISKKTGEAPNLVSIISQKEIKDYGRVSINDVLYQLPGFSPSMDYDRRTVSSRGMFEGWNNNHLLLLIDGVQFNDSLYGSAYTWEITPLSMVKNMEVIRGPGSALYGSNATNGVVSLNTYSGEDLKGELRLRTRQGDYGTQIYDFLTGNKGTIFSYTMNYSSYQTNGNSYPSYDGSFRTDLFGFYQKFDVKDERKNDYVFIKLEGEDFLKGLSLQYHRQSWNYKTSHGWLWEIPDTTENLSESMDTLSIKYTNNITDKLIQEYVLRLQDRNIDWNVRFSHNGSYEGYYPSGITEVLKTGAKELLGRAQFTYLFDNGGSALVGIEASGFKYTGDKTHYSNIDFLDPDYAPYPDGQFMKQGPWLEWIKDKTVPKGAVFGQVVSGKFFNKMVELTLGVRYDEKNIKYRQIDEPYKDILGFSYKPDAKRVFRRTSPRAGLVFFLTNSMNLKVMVGRAFREPSITELFGANTFTLASNPKQLKPEIINTREIALDWFLTQNLNFRTNIYDTRFENQIAYSVANNNLSSNIYTLHTRGLESEILYNIKSLSLFANYSYNQRINEHILDQTISPHKKAVTWAPTNTQNIGTRGEYKNYYGSVSVQRQSQINRRNSDFGTPDEFTGYVYIDPFSFPQYRKQTVPAWYNVNFKLSYSFSNNMNIGLFISNAFKNNQMLVKNNLYPFDYQRENRRAMLDFSASF